MSFEPALALLRARVPAPPAVPAEPRPRLRGWLHAAAVPLAVVAAVVLYEAAAPGAPRLSVAVFGGALVGLFGVSATYHVPDWPGHVRRWLGRLDVAMIQLFIASAYTPIGVHALEGAWQVGSLAVVWIIGLIGAALAATPVRAPRWLSVTAYTAFASLALVPLVRIVDVLPLAGVGLLLSAGALYLLGGVVYARGRPDPWPDTFGFHEVFHLLVVLGGAVHVYALLAYALPLA